MASHPRVSFSGEHLVLPRISQHHGDIEASVRDYFSLRNPTLGPRFAGYTPSEVQQEMASVLKENERSTCMTILASLEAAFRLDYLQRCYMKGKDTLSREFRHIHASKGLPCFFGRRYLFGMETEIRRSGVHYFGTDRGVQVQALACAWAVLDSQTGGEDI